MYLGGVEEHWLQSKCRGGEGGIFALSYAGSTLLEGSVAKIAKFDFTKKIKMNVKQQNHQKYLANNSQIAEGYHGLFWYQNEDQIWSNFDQIWSK